MPTYSTPGVYFEWLDTRQQDLQLQRTDVTGFVGIAARGPLHCPLKVESWSQFTGLFGGPIPQGYLAYAVQAFFANGGRTCWVVRVADPDSAKPAALELHDENGRPALRLTAKTPGTWARTLAVSVLRGGSDRFTLTLQLPDGTQEIWRDLTLASVESVLPAKPPLKNSGLVYATAFKGAGVPRLPALAFLTGGRDGLAKLTLAHLSGRGAPRGKVWGLATLASKPEISILCMPDCILRPKTEYLQVTVPPRCDVLDAPTPPTPPPADDIEYPPSPRSPGDVLELERDMVLQCEILRDRVAILDLPDPSMLPAEAIAWRRQFDTTYAGLYYPWLRVPDPLGLPGALLDLPPSGHVAGIYARVERQVGSHKPPANELLAQAQDVTRPVNDILHGLLNEAAVNALRVYPGRGLRVAGERTLSSDPLWRYVNVRRLLIMIERSIDVGTQWIVFEPNNPRMWMDTARVISHLLDFLWRRGMLDGAVAEQAYTVQCDESTNLPEETNAGRVICRIRVKPPYPAEYVIARIGRTEEGSLVLEG